MKRLALILLSISLLLTTPAKTDSWPQFRGPQGNGIANADNIPLEFGESENLAWKTPLPGRGWSSPVLADGKIWLTTATEVFPTEEERLKILEESGEKPKTFKVRQVATSIDLAVQQVDFETGKLIREIPLTKVESPKAIHALNSFASPTPVLEDGKLYAHFGTYGTFCVDTTSGEIIWQEQLPLEHSVGPGSSPFLYKELLVLICDGVDAQFVTALDKNTGKRVWRTERPEMRAALGDQKKAYCTPIAITTRDGVDQLICMGSQWLVSYEPETGKEIWRFDHGNGFSVVPRPVFSEENQLVYISTGFGKAEMIAIAVDGKGDISGTDKEVWRVKKSIPNKPSFLLHDDLIYTISDTGVAFCFDPKTGEEVWGARVGGNFSASPLFADGKIFFASHEGKVTVIEPGREYKVLAENQLDEKFKLMASPLAVDGALLFRSENALYRFGK